MKSGKILLLCVISAVLLGVSFGIAQPQSPCNPCITFCSYTQGGWGAPCNGGNVGCLRDQNFASVYPGGVTIGGIYTIHFTSSQAVEDFLPQGQVPDVLHQNWVDPGVVNITVFAGQVLALQLNVDFGAMGINGMPDISGLTIATGPFAGYTVAQLLSLANQVLGSDVGALPPGTTISDLNDACSAVNMNFDNCVDNDHYLDIPPMGETAVVRNVDDPYPFSFCLSFTPQCQDICVMWWCDGCRPDQDFADFTWVPGCNGPDCDEDCVPNPGVLTGLDHASQQWMEPDPSGHGCWWYALAHADEAGCFCVTFEFQLPVELGSFAAIPRSNQVDINWTTASEQDIDHFEIVRDGEVMTHVDATNNATGSNYSWIDHNVTNGMTYSYSLIAEDMNGSRNTLATQSVTPSATPVVAEYALYQNYPNPFNPTTSIGFDLLESGMASLKVYNMIGQQVAVLANGIQSAGHHEVTFDATGLPSGLYLYRLEANDVVLQKKMLLMK